MTHLYPIRSSVTSFIMADEISWNLKILWVLINSLAPERFEWNFRYVILKLILVIGGWGISCEISPQINVIAPYCEKSTLVQVMAWGRQATSHYLSQCWLSPMSPFGVKRPQWINWRCPSSAFCPWHESLLYADMQCGTPLWKYACWWPITTLQQGSLLLIWINFNSGMDK